VSSLSQLELYRPQLCTVKLLWNLEFDFEFLLSFFKNLLEDYNVRRVESHRKLSEAVGFCRKVGSRHKKPRGRRILLQRTKGRPDLAANTKGQLNLIAKHQGTQSDFNVKYQIWEYALFLFFFHKELTRTIRK